MQTWCDLLNTPISQAPLTPAELASLSPLHRILSQTIILPIHTLHLWSVVHRVLMLLRHIHILHLHLRSVIHRVLMLLHRIHTHHLHHMATHHIHILLPQLVVRRMVLLLNHIHTPTSDISVPSASTCSLRR
jgi:hypothetical protein